MSDRIAPMSTPVRLHDISTPALVIDAGALDRNIRRMAAFFADGPCRLRPHVKAHKTPEVARRQLAAGSCVGLTCATVDEAEMVAEFCDDILLANEIVLAAKCDRVAALAGRTRMTVAIDSPDGLRAVAAAASRAGTVLDVLVDLDVGQGRCGVQPGADAVALARLVTDTPGVRLRGVMGYEGHVQPVRERAAREAQARESMGRLVATADALRAAGLPCDVVSGGGTGTYDISGRVPGVTEIQAGSYALMDTDYGAVEVGFEHAFFVLGTVVSCPVPGRAVADCGHKSTTKDHGHPGVKDIPGATVTSLNDEHATIALPPGVTLAIGDRVALLPSHTDPTINLHDALYVVEGDHVVDVWPVVGRGYAAHRRVLDARRRA
jgi:D-serine deaminase-like pyridoxal phosphate-dependent protein